MRFNERSLIVLVSVLLVAAAAAAIVIWVGRDPDEDAGGDAAAIPFELAGNAASSLEGGPDELLLLSGTHILRQTIDPASQEVVKNVKTQSVYASPGSAWVAYVASGSGSEDFTTQPELRLYDLETEDKTKLGAGVAPVWNRQGTHVAFLRPLEPRNCVAEECSGDVQLAIADAATGEDSVHLEPGTYSILGWAGAHVLVSDFARPDLIVSVSLDGDTNELDFPATQFWDASPDGGWLIKTNARKTEFVEFEDGRLGDRRVPIGLGDAELLEGSWSHDSETVAAVVRAGQRVTDTSVVTFSPDEPELVPVDDSSAALGRVLWSADNDTLVFGRLLDPKQALIQAVWCPLGNEEGCKSVISWTEGIALLRMQ